MARPRKPTALLELQGAFKHDPQRRRDGEPKPNTKIGDAPGRLPVEAQAFWDEIVLQAGAWLTGSDRWAVELAAMLMEKATRKRSVAAILELAALGEMSSDEIKEMVRSETISSAELSTLRSLLSALGMTPADRSKLSVKTEAPKNKFAEFTQEKNTAARPN